ncbi:MAG: peptidase T [Oscillospiraceae bacterium]
MRAYERFLEYVKINTEASDTSGAHPSTDIQKILAQRLCAELKELGCKDAIVTNNAYVYASIPASKGCETAKALGLIAHLDTAPAFSGADIKPILHENYDGKDIVLPKCGRVISAAQFPFLQGMRGKTVITADGSTLLGADDKAGVAEIMALVERVLKQDIKHGKLCIAFTPDEEIGEGADLFDVKAFGADYAYTMDGDLVGGIEYENFNAAAATLNVQGVSVHPGSAKDIMVNALSLVCEAHSMLPQSEVPECTEGREGFYMVEKICGDTASAKAEYIIRDHSAIKFAEKKADLQRIKDELSAKYPTASISLEIKDSYYNMIEKIEPVMFLIDYAKAAAEAVGETPRISAIRGGTDGARLSYMGLPCPNLGTGGANFHGPYELIAKEDMDKAVDMLEKLIQKFI